MDVRIRERLVGALVLVAVIVLTVPALLKGPGTTPGQPAVAGSRSVEIVLDGAATPETGEKLVPEPEIASAASDPADRVKPAVAQDGQQAPRGEKAPPGSSGNAGSAPGSAGATAAQPPAWAVQLGAFAGRAKAEKLVAALRSRGYAAFVLEYRADGQLLHRVRVGPEQDRARAVAIAERLRKDGFNPVVAPHP